VASFARLGSRDCSCPTCPPVATLSKAMLSASTAQLSRPSILSAAVACPCQITLYKRVSRSVWSNLNSPMVNHLLLGGMDSSGLFEPFACPFNLRGEWELTSTNLQRVLGEYL